MLSLPSAFLLAFGLGALCMLLGFAIIVGGAGTADSESVIKFLGFEIRFSRVGPGVLFAAFGLVLAIIAVQKLTFEPEVKPPVISPTLQTRAAERFVIGDAYTLKVRHQLSFAGSTILNF